MLTATASNTNTVVAIMSKRLRDTANITGTSAINTARLVFSKSRVSIAM
jgi:hypothetical protein